MVSPTLRLGLFTYIVTHRVTQNLPPNLTRELDTAITLASVGCLLCFKTLHDLIARIVLASGDNGQ